MIIAAVQKSKARTPDEEIDHLKDTLNSIGNFFSWEEHPNRIRAANIHRERIYKKFKKVLDSEEYKEYNPYH